MEFFAAVKHAESARVRELLACDLALVRARDDDGATALDHAAERGHREIVSLLLDAGADVNARDERFHATPAGWAMPALAGASDESEPRDGPRHEGRESA